MSEEKQFSIDFEVLSGFIDEAQDELLNATDSFISLQQDGYDEAILQSIFRIFHSIKGNAAYFSLFAIKEFSHKLEQLLDKLRKKEIPISDDIINALIAGSNSLSNAFHKIQAQGIEAELPPDFKSVQEEITHFLGSDLAHLPPADLLLIINDLHEIQSQKATLESVLQKYKTLLNTQDSTVPSTNTFYLQNEAISQLFSLLQNSNTDLLDNNSADNAFALLSDCMPLSTDADYQDGLQKIIDNFVLLRNTVGLDALMRQLLVDDLQSLFQNHIIPQELATNDSSEDENETSSTSNDSKVATNQPVKTIRISEKSVDMFLEYVGELIIVKELYTNLTSSLTAANFDRKLYQRQMKKATEMFSELSRSLQKSIMEIRKVPVSQLFKKMPKIVHDVASQTNKKIRVSIQNDNVLVDKAVIEKLEAPMIHMIRNAADHGIEKPDLRSQLGKNPTGTITLDSQIIGDMVQIEISDDGAGLNMQAMHTKAIELGLVQPNAPFSEEHCIDVMFASGVSTSENVTDISGRGVGMDVVKQSLDSAGGKIITKTKSGQGTSFYLQMPLEVTTQIITGFVVRSGEDRIIIPIENVESTISAKNIPIQSAQNNGHYIKHNNFLIPLNNLEQVIHGYSANLQVHSSDIIIILTHETKRNAYIINGLEGIKQLVLKNIALPPQQLQFFKGGAVMGDGSVALILNPEIVIE